MLDKIEVKKTTNPDDGYEDIDILFKDTLQHKKDVGLVLANIGKYIKEKGECHDWTKVEFFDNFAKDCLERKDTMDFKQRDWYHIHTTKERHHLNASCPEDVDLFDVLEMIVDCIIAGKTRTGEVNKYFLILKEDMLEKAYWNTVKKINDSVIVKD